MTIGWIGIDDTNLDSVCGEEAAALVADALKGDDFWEHDTTEIHFVILDLITSQWVTKVRGRSATNKDPINVNIFVSDSKDDWGDAVKTGIDTWKDGGTWVVIEVTPKKGRYVKIEITRTEAAGDITPGELMFGSWGPSMQILDVHIGAQPTGKAGSRCGSMKIEGVERLRGIRSNAVYG